MKKDIQNYFDIARNNLDTESLFTQQEIRNLTEKSSELNTAQQSIFSIIKRKWKMLSASSIFITGMVYLLLNFSTSTEEKTIHIANKEDLKELQTKLSKQPKEERNINSSEYLKKSESDNANEPYFDQETINNPKTFPLFKLTKKEFENLGFSFNETGFKTLAASRDPYEQYEDQLKAAGYKDISDKTLFRFIFSYDSNDDTNKQIIPSKDINKNIPNHILPISFMYHYRSGGDCGTGIAEIEQGLLLDKYCASQLGRFEGRTVRQQILKSQKFDLKTLNLAPNKSKVIRNLLFIYGNFKFDDKQVFMAFWYLPSRKLLKKLPERYRTTISKKFVMRQKLNSSDIINTVHLDLSSDSKYAWNSLEFNSFNQHLKGQRKDKSNPTFNKNDFLNLYKNLRQDLAPLKVLKFEVFNSQKKILAYKNRVKDQIEILRDDNISEQQIKKLQLYTLMIDALSSMKAQEGMKIEGTKSIDLTEEELKKINIIKKGTDLTWYSDVLYNDIQSKQLLSKTLEDNNYDIGSEKVIARYMWFYRSKFTDEIKDHTIVTYSGTDKNNPTKKFYYGKKLLDGAKMDNNYSKISPIMYTHPGMSSNIIQSPIAYYSKDIYNEIYDFIPKLTQTPDYRLFVARLARQMRTEKDKDKQEQLIEKIDKYTTLLSRLVPIKLPFSLAPITLWFIPNQEFLDALPERYSKKLKRELEIIRKIEEDKIPFEIACKGFSTEESLLDICRLKSGDIEKLLCAPNPANEETEARFILINDRKISLSLHDSNGNLIKWIFKDENYDAGKHEENVNLSDVKAGVYLLTLTSDKGEQVVQKLVKI